MIAIVLGIVRVLIVLMIVRLIVSFFMQFRRRPPVRPRQRAGHAAEVSGGTLVRDPHCGTYIPESKAVVSDGLFFCSSTCRDAWASAHRRTTGLKA